MYKISLCFPLTRIHVAAFRAYPENPGKSHLKSLDLITAAKIVFSKQANVYRLRSLKPDVFRGHHSAYYDVFASFSRSPSGNFLWFLCILDPGWNQWFLGLITPLVTAFDVTEGDFRRIGFGVAVVSRKWLFYLRRTGCVLTCVSVFCPRLSGIFYYPWNWSIFQVVSNSFWLELSESIQFAKDALVLVPLSAPSQRSMLTVWILLLHSSPSVMPGWSSVFYIG